MQRFLPFLFLSLLLCHCGAPPNENAAEEATEPTRSKDPVKELVEVEATYEYEKKMLLDSIHRFEFVLSKNLNRKALAEIAPTLAHSETLKERPAKIGDYVSAELIDPSKGENFDITPLSLEEQSILISDTFSCLWQWDIRPLKKGTLPLRLKVLTRLDDREMDIPVFDTNIDVYSNETKGFPLVYAGVGLALLGLLAFLFLRKKKANQERSHLPNALALEIKRLVGDGKTIDALELLEAHLEQAKSAHLNDVIVLQSNFQDAVRKNNVGVMAGEEFRQEATKVNFALLELVKTLS